MKSGREHLAWILVVEGPAGNTWRGILAVEESSREHWAWMVVVEVRQGNTGRGWSWLRSGREHLAWMIVVEVPARRRRQLT